MAWAVPALKIGGGALASWLIGKKAGQPTSLGQLNLTSMPGWTEAMGAAKGVETSAQGLETTAAGLGRQGRGLFQFAQPMLQQSGRYFGSLLGGSRASMTQAVEPEAVGIRDLYRGASRTIASGNLRGAARDMAIADVSREAAGKIGGLLPAVRPGAAAALAGMGQFGTTAGAGMQEAGGGLQTSAGGLRASAGGLYSDLLKSGLSAQQYQDLLKLQAGQASGNLFFQLLKTFPDFFFGKGKNTGTTGGMNLGYSGPEGSVG